MRTWLLLLLLGCGEVGAQPPQPSLHAVGHSALGDIVRYRRPMQLQIDIDARDPKLNHDVQFELVNDNQSITRTGLRLQSGSRQLMLPVPYVSYGPKLEAEGLPSPGNLTLNLDHASDQDMLTLVLSPRPNQFGYLGGYKSLLRQGEFRLNQPRPGTPLPDLWWTYLSHDLIVLHDLPALKLEDRTEVALRRWTEAGGSLVLVSNLDPREYQDTEFAELTPLRATGLTSGKTPFLIGEARGEVLVRQGSTPLLLRRPLGLGWIFQICAPAVDQDLLGSKVTQRLWQEVLSHTNSLPLRQALEGEGRLSTLPELPPPATSPLAWYLVGYVLLAVPGVYVYLRRKDQVLRLILFIPACSLLFSGGAYYFNTLGRGREMIVRELGLALMRSGQSTALCDLTSAFFSPRSLKFGLKIDPQTLCWPVSQVQNRPASVFQWRGDELTVEGEKLSQWGVSRWRSTALRDLSGTIDFRCRRDTPQSLLAEIDNRSELAFEQAMLCYDRNTTGPPFTLKQGAQRQSLQLSGPTRTLLEVLRQTDLKLSGEDLDLLVTQIETARDTRPTLLAWTRDRRFSTLSLQGLRPRQQLQTLLMVLENP